MKKLKFKHVSKSIITSLLVGFGLCFSFQPKLITHAASSGYALGIAPDFDQFMYQTTLVIEDHNVDPTNYNELKILIPKKGFTNEIPDTFGVKWEVGNIATTPLETMFVFPANNSEATKTGPDGKDSEAVTRVTTQVLSQLNQAINFIISNGMIGDKPLITLKLSEAEKMEWFYKITAELGNHSIKMQPNGSYSKPLIIPGIDTQFRITKKSETSSFLTLETADGKKKIELRYRIQKYKEGKTEGTDDYDRSGNFPTIYWFHFVWMGNATYANKGISATNISKLGSEGYIAEQLYGFLDGVLQGIKTKLGLESISNIVFNQGSFAVRNWNGIAPTDWFEAGNILFWICQILAWITLALAVVWMFGSTMWGTVTPFKRVTLMEGIKDISVASISTALIYPIFLTLTKFNVLLVDIMGDLTIFNDRIGSSTISGGTMAGMILVILFFGIEVYFNFVYLLRGVTIVLLYGMAPIFFMVYAFGGSFKGITFKYIKELIGNIFIHTFHATFLAFFAIFMNTASMGFFTQLVLLYAFLPMTKLFKQLTGIGESDFISSTAEQAKDTLKSTGNAVVGGVAGGIAGGFTAGKMLKGKTTGGGDNGGGGGGLKGDSMSGGFGGDTSKGSLTGQLGKAAANKVSNAANKLSSTKMGETFKNSPQGQMMMNAAKAGAKVGQAGAKVGKTAKSLYNSNTGQVLRAVGKAAVGTGLAATGAMVGNKQLTKAGQSMTSTGIGGAIQSGKAVVSDIQEKIHGQELQSDNVAHIGGYNNEDGTRTDTYNQEALYESTGVEDMDMVRGEGGKQVLRQKIDPSMLSDDMKDFLENTETDMNGNVESAALRDLGLSNIKKTHDGKYIVSYDAEKRGLNSVKRSGNKYIMNQSGYNGESQNHLKDIRNRHQANERAEARQKEAQERTNRRQANERAEQRQKEAQERMNQRQAEEEARRKEADEFAEQRQREAQERVNRRAK